MLFTRWPPSHTAAASQFEHVLLLRPSLNPSLSAPRDAAVWARVERGPEPLWCATTCTFRSLEILWGSAKSEFEARESGDTGIKRWSCLVTEVEHPA